MIETENTDLRHKDQHQSKAGSADEAWQIKQIKDKPSIKGLIWSQVYSYMWHSVSSGEEDQTAFSEVQVSALQPSLTANVFYQSISYT